MHKIVVDRSHAVVSVTAEGYFGEAELAAAAAELHVAIRSLGVGAGRHVTLYDFSALKVVPSPVLDRFERYFTDPAMAPVWAARVALVVSSPLVAMQMDRLRKVRDTLRVFGDRREAMAWLLAAQDRVRTTSQPTVASG